MTGRCARVTHARNARLPQNGVPDDRDRRGERALSMLAARTPVSCHRGGSAAVVTQTPDLGLVGATIWCSTIRCSAARGVV